MKGNVHGLRARWTRHLILLFFVGCVCGFAADFVPNRILILPKPAKAADAEKIRKQKGRKTLKKFPKMRNLEVIELRAGENVLDAVEEYVSSGTVEFAEPDYILHASVTPNDPNYISGQWHLNSSASGDPDIDAAEGWEIIHEAPNVIVAIADSGMRMTHEDLAPNLWINPNEIPDNGLDDDGNGYVDDVHGINAMTGGLPLDDEGHGTHVAGIIGAVGNNGKGGAGVAWKVKLMALKFLDSEGNGSTSDAITCINYAVEQGANVINASFGSQIFSPSMQSAIQSAREGGVILVAAAGNEGSNNDVIASYPANYSLDNIVTVAATASSGVLDTSYSNYGATTVDLAAPGTGILSCGMNSDSSYVTMSGTSMATPVVSGILALMRAHYTNATHTEIIQRLLATVDPVPSLLGRTVTGGKANLQKALSPYANAAFSASALAGTSPLSVSFTNSSIGDIAGISWNFGDGSITSTSNNPTHVFINEGSYSVTLTVTVTNGSVATFTRTVNVVPTYIYSAIDYEWINPPITRRIFLADNGVSGAETLPFAFKFYGEDRTQIHIGANGLLGFDPVNMSAAGNADIPSAGSPNGTILPYWDNLNPASVGAVHVGTAGEAPHRQFVVSWVGVTRNSSTDTMTFQAVLHESGEIQFNYQEVRPASTRGGGLRATIGLEDPSGTLATKYGYNGSPNRIGNNQSLLFVANTKEPTSIKGVAVVNGQFQMQLSSLGGLTFVIETSADLQTWSEVQRGIIGAEGAIPFAQPVEPAENRFFRALVLP